MRSLLLLAPLLALAACSQPTEDIDESQASAEEELAPTVSPEQMDAADQPLGNVEQAPDAIDADVAAEEAPSMDSKTK